MYLLLIFYLWLKCCTSYDCKDDVCLLPKDPYVFIGESLVLNCSVSEDSECRGNFTFMKGDDSMSSQHYQTISSTTSHLSIPANESFNGVFFTCVVSDPFCQASQVVQVEYPPRKVTNWTVVIYNWETLNLTWDPGQYLRSNSVNITTLWSPGKGWFGCSTSTTTSCYLDKENYNDSDNYTFSINVINNKRNVSAVTVISILSANYVKPAPVIKLTVTKDISREVTLKWEHSRQYRPFQFKVKYTGNNITSYRITTMSYITIPNLKPYTKYTFEVSAKSNSSTRDNWSDSVSLNYTTSEDRPTFGPSVAPGGFMYHKCVGDRRNITVYMKAPDEEYQNGILRYYTASYKSHDTYNITNISYPASCIPLYDLACDMDYNVKLYVSTSSGSSPSSALHIQQKHNNVSQFVGVLLPADNTPVQVHWDFRPLCRYSNWTVYWCKLVESHTCQDSLEWKTLGGTYNSTNLTVTRNDVIFRNISFAISGNKPSGSSGMVWTTCILDLLNDTPSLHLSDNHPNLGLSVRWSVKQCAAETLVDSYVIEHCYNDVCVNETVAREKREYSILQLTGNVPYNVRIMLTSITGNAGPFSETVVGVPDNKYLRTGMIIGGITGALVVIAILLVLSVRHIRLTLAERENIEVPRLAEDIHLTAEIYRSKQNNSPDSGNSSMEDAPFLHTVDHGPKKGDHTVMGGHTTLTGTDSVDYARFDITVNEATSQHDTLKYPETSGEVSSVGNSGTGLSQSNGIQCQNENSGWDPGSNDEDDSVACPYVTAGYK